MKRPTGQGYNIFQSLFSTPILHLLPDNVEKSFPSCRSVRFLRGKRREKYWKMTNETPIIQRETIADAWVTVSLPALRANAQCLRALLDASASGPSPRLMAVVKANAYGHGAFQAARAFLEGGADALAVTTLSEALELTDAVIDSRETPILVFAPLVTREQLELAVARGLHLTVCDSDHVRLAREAAKAQGETARLHLKVDTGMGRLGLAPTDALNVARQFANDEFSQWAGVYTHFARASEPDLTPTRTQLAIFEKFCNDLGMSGLTGVLRHCANSAALIRLPESRLDMVRAGTVLYGQAPSASVLLPDGIRRDSWKMQARVVFVHDLEPGATVGYGAEYLVKRPTRAAVLPIGYADGFTLQPASLTAGPRGLKSWLDSALGRRRPHVLFDGKRAPVLGRVAMQMIVVDVGGFSPPIRAGDVATGPYPPSGRERAAAQNL